MDDGCGSSVTLDPGAFNMTGYGDSYCSITTDNIGLYSGANFANITPDSLYVTDGNYNVSISPGSVYITGNGSINLTPPGKNCGFGALEMCISEDATDTIYVLMCS
jgi:hypothetical protein